MQNLVVLVTGAAAGIGAACVAAFDAAGWSCVGVDRTYPSTTAREVSPTVLCCGGDVSLAPDWQRWLDETYQQYGRLDAVINNAGIAGPICDFLEYPDDAFDAVMAVNARGVFLGTKYSAARMIAAGTTGAIVNIASNAGLAGSPRIVGYSASKHAVIGITKSAAKAFATRNVRVNAICPAPTDTAMVRNLELYSSAEQVRSALTAGTPMGRYGEPAEIAATALFLSSAAASFITGAIVPVDGGSVA